MTSFKYVEQGAGRYVAGNIEPFDQKNEMFKRPFWDPQMKALGKKFYFTSVPPARSIHGECVLAIKR